MFNFSIEGTDFVWNESYTVNVYVGPDNVDVYSLNYGRVSHSKSEVMASALEWITTNV